jgi:hypothetical protein
MLLHECVTPRPFESTDAVFQRFVEHPGEACYSSAMPPEWDHCMTTTVAWAVGSQGKIYSLECEASSLPIAFPSMPWILTTAPLCVTSHMAFVVLNGLFVSVYASKILFRGHFQTSIWPSHRHLKHRTWNLLSHEERNPFLVQLLIVEMKSVMCTSASG